MASPKEEKEDPPDESWMGTFADTITLLMAFFVMLLTFSEFDIPAYEELSSAMASTVESSFPEKSNVSLCTFNPLRQVDHC